jgi:hypothetical protein
MNWIGLRAAVVAQQHRTFARFFVAVASPEDDSFDDRDENDNGNWYYSDSIMQGPNISNAVSSLRYAPSTTTTPLNNTHPSSLSSMTTRQASGGGGGGGTLLRLPSQQPTTTALFCWLNKKEGSKTFTLNSLSLSLWTLVTRYAVVKQQQQQQQQRMTTTTRTWFILTILKNHFVLLLSSSMVVIRHYYHFPYHYWAP